MSNENIGAMIHEKRLALGLTLEEVGDAVGVGKSTVRKWETGMIRNMGRDKITKLAEVLQINPALLISSPARTEDDERLEALHQNPRLGLLFDRSRKMSHEDVEFMLQMADRILKERDANE